MTEKEREWLDGHFQRIYSEISEVKVAIARIEAAATGASERGKKLEEEQKSIRGRMWGLVILVLAAASHALWDLAKKARS